MDQVCQFVSKSLHLFSEYRLHKSVDRGEEWTDGRTDRRTNGRTTWEHYASGGQSGLPEYKTLYKELVDGDRLNQQVDLPVCIVFVLVISSCSGSCSQLFLYWRIDAGRRVRRSTRILRLNDGDETEVTKTSDNPCRGLCFVERTSPAQPRIWDCDRQLLPFKRQFDCCLRCSPLVAFELSRVGEWSLNAILLTGDWFLAEHCP